MTLDLGMVNWIAVLVGAAIYFILGAVWYSPVLFAKPWQAAIGWDESRAQPQTNPVTCRRCSKVKRRPSSGVNTSDATDAPRLRIVGA